MARQHLFAMSERLTQMLFDHIATDTKLFGHFHGTQMIALAQQEHLTTARRQIINRTSDDLKSLAI